MGTTFRIYMHSCQVFIHALILSQTKTTCVIVEITFHIFDLNVAISYAIHVVLYFALIMKLLLLFSCFTVSLQSLFLFSGNYDLWRIWIPFSTPQWTKFFSLSLGVSVKLAKCWIGPFPGGSERSLLKSWIRHC